MIYNQMTCYSCRWYRINDGLKIVEHYCKKDHNDGHMRAVDCNDFERYAGAENN